VPAPKKAKGPWRGLSTLTAHSLQNSTAWKRWITFATFGNETGTHVLLRSNGLGKLLGYEACNTVFPPREASELIANGKIYVGVDTENSHVAAQPHYSIVME